MSIEVILHDAVRSAVRDPQQLIGRDEVSIRRRSNARLPHVEEFSILIEDLNSPVSPIDDEQPAILADLNAVNRVELVRSGILRILRRTAPLHQEFSVFVKLCHSGAA